VKYGIAVYNVTRFLAGCLIRVLFRFRVEGQEKVPANGPLIVISNHMSFMDPVLMGIAVPRAVSYISRDDIFKYPVASWWLPRLYVIPVSRGAGDLGAVKAAIRTLKEGMAFGIFPEGRRSRTGRLEPFKTGTAAIALRANATLIPAAIIGSDQAWPVGGWPRLLRPIRVVFGEPIVLDGSKADHQAIEDLTERLEAAVGALLPEEYREKPTV
jgi:1-acyl-sn-glycerol-3-phosphate acyltransferase